VTLTGFMQPLGEDLELSAFLLIEYPVGCCIAKCLRRRGLSMLNSRRRKRLAMAAQRSRLRGITLNSNDPENFLTPSAKRR